MHTYVKEMLDRISIAIVRKMTSLCKHIFVSISNKEIVVGYLVMLIKKEINHCGAIFPYHGTCVCEHIILIMFLVVKNRIYYFKSLKAE